MSANEAYEKVEGGEGNDEYELVAIPPKEPLPLPSRKSDGYSV